jgi:putative ABC transport system ATP-binding protein
MPDSIISVEHVHKSVTDSTGTLDILRDIDFSLAARETAAIVGASGSGKSTLLSIVAGLDTPTSGTVKLDGEDLFALDEDDRAALRARKVGFVFQSFQLLGNLTALENVMLPLELAGRRDARKAAGEMLARVGLAERWATIPRCCPAASSSAWRWPAPSSSSPPCCWPTSPPAASTSPPARR